jgi:methionine-rich copper-binding protein CopC
MGRRLLALAVLILGGAAQPALAGDMSLISSSPKPNQTIGGTRASIALEFGAPVDHAASRLTLVAPNATRTLRARLSSRPNTVFATAGDLPKGHYLLKWQVRSMDGQQVSGELPFEVGDRK